MESSHLLMCPGIRSSLVVQSPGSIFPTSGVKAQLLTIAPRPHKTNSAEDKKKKKNPKTLSEGNTQQPRSPRETHTSPPLFLGRSLDLLWKV